MSVKYPSLESFNFLGQTGELTEARTFILPVPYEASTTYGTNTRQGPQAIIEASRHVETYDAELRTDISKTGIYTGPMLEPDTRGPEAMTGRIFKTVKKIFQSQKFPLLLGGEHAITPGAVKAARDVFPDLSVLHFDAHADLRDSYQDSPDNHACALRRIRDFVKKTVSVGVRSFAEEEIIYIKKYPNCRIFGAEKLRSKKAEILKGLSDRVYLSIDLDALDPSQMPAVGTPEPGGLFWNELLEILREVFLKKIVVAADVVELAPIPGLIHPDFLAARLVYKLIGYKQQSGK